MISERARILYVTDQFVKGIRKNSFYGLDKYFVENVKVTTSILGQGQGIKAVHSLFKYKGPRVEVVKQNIENMLLHYHNERAQQSFHLIQCFVRHDDQGQFHFLQTGGTYVLSYIKQDGDWYITDIKYDLCWFDGNNYWIKDWKLIDFKMPKVHKQVIHCLDDGVFHHFYKSDENMSDEEQIKELGFIYGWTIDTEDYSLLKKKTTSSFRVYDGYHQKEFKGAESWIEFLTKLNSNEPCLHHTYQVTNVKIEGDKGILYMSRLEPNRIGSRFIGEHSWFYDWLTLDYTVEVVKINGEWLLQDVSFITRYHEEKSRGVFEEIDL